ncbi:Uncharacterized protein APZ42_015323 [Daphnia magna]|uniref:Uncharacterized protein n=1 Tax=Daphnia magna TaxID=35525 RepID=A0A162PDD3_9CRUS|nr:Uncharacterized protein APZ42_015323 [Daphnia magna]
MHSFFRPIFDRNEEEITPFLSSTEPKRQWLNLQLKEDAVRERMNGRERRPIMKTGALLVDERIETDAIVVINHEIYHVYTVVFF